MYGMKTWFTGAILLVFGLHSAEAATINGVVKLAGNKVPKREVLKMDADPECMAKHSDQLLSESLVVDADKNIKNAFVYIKSGLDGKTFKPPKQPAVLDQVGCVYTPHILGIMTGQPLRVLNSDALFHNINSGAKVNKGFKGFRFEYN